MRELAITNCLCYIILLPLLSSSKVKYFSLLYCKFVFSVYTLAVPVVIPFFYLLSEAQQISAGRNKLGMPACRGLSLVSFQFPFDDIKII